MINGTGIAKATFCLKPIFLKSTALLVRIELVIWVDRLTIITVTKKEQKMKEQSRLKYVEAEDQSRLERDQSRLGELVVH